MGKDRNLFDILILLYVTLHFLPFWGSFYMFFKKFNKRNGMFYNRWRKKSMLTFHQPSSWCVFFSSTANRKRLFSLLWKYYLFPMLVLLNETKNSTRSGNGKVLLNRTRLQRDLPEKTLRFSTFFLSFPLLSKTNEISDFRDFKIKINSSCINIKTI